MNIVVDSAPGLMSYWSDDLHCLFSNKAYADWFGRSRAEMNGIRYESLLGTALAVRNRAFVDGVLAGKPQRFEQDLPAAGGGRIQTLTHYIPDTVDGVVVGFIAHVADVSVLKDTEQALREEVEERQRANVIIRAAIEALEEAQRLGQIGSWAWTTTPDTVLWSKELFRIMGRDPALPAPPFAQQGDIFTPKSWTRLRRLVENALGTGEPYRTELDYIRPDGVTGRLDARGEAVHGDDGTIVGLRGTARNMGADIAPA
jgi:PAS domain-containing protein